MRYVPAVRRINCIMDVHNGHNQDQVAFEEQFVKSHYYFTQCGFVLDDLTLQLD